MRSFRLSPAAAEDLAEIHRYSRRQWTIARADLYLQKLQADIAALAETSLPHETEPALRAPYRRRASQSHSIYYRLDGDDIVVMRVLHGRMDAARHF